MKGIKYAAFLVTGPVLLIAVVLCGFRLYLENHNGGFAREIPLEEQNFRLRIVDTAQSWIGVQEDSEAHEEILRIYNTHEPLAQGYAVKTSDNWCAAFGSAIAVQCSVTDIVPTECGCERQTLLWKELGRWEENDNYMPLPGDYIYYAWDEERFFGDCVGWSDHVGIVVGTAGPFIKVIEGNKDDMVTYRIILRGNHQIRGYGLPDYGSKIG